MLLRFRFFVVTGSVRLIAANATPVSPSRHAKRSDGITQGFSVPLPEHLHSVSITFLAVSWYKPNIPKTVTDMSASTNGSRRRLSDPKVFIEIPFPPRHIGRGFTLFCRGDSPPKA